MPPQSGTPDSVQNNQTPPVQPEPVQPPPPPPPLPPEQPLVTASAPRRSPKGLIIAVFILLILVAVVVVMGMTGVLPMSFLGKAPYSQEHLLTNIAQGLSKIKTTSYEVELGIHSKPRDADAQPFKLEVPEDAELTAKLKRDQDRIRDWQMINTSLLENGINKHKVFPNSIDSLQVASKNPDGSAYSYKPSADGLNYELVMTFETSQAIDAIRRYDNKTGIQDKTVTFTKDSTRYVYLDSQIRQPEIVEILSSQDYVDYLPSSLDITTKVTGSTQTVGTTTNGKLGFTAQANFGDAMFAFDAELRKIDNAFFVQATKFPDFFGAISALKGKWIKIVPEDLTQYGLGMGYSTPDSLQKEYDKEKKKFAEQLKLLLELADKNQAIQMEGDAVKENVNGVTAYRYDLMLNRANIVKFYQNAADEFTKKYGNESPIRLDSETLDFLNSSSAEAVFDYINKNTQLSVWANAEGIPVKFQISMRIVPNSRKAITNQINLDLALNLIDINKSVTIETPADAMSVEDAYMLITGKTKEEINLEKQTQAIATIRYALEEYKRTNQAKTYPQSLQELTKSRSEVASQKAIDGDVYNYYDGPFIATIPTDAYTKQAFGYSSDGKTYALTYTINLPPYTSGASAYGLYEYDYSTTNNQKIYLKYIQGTNTSDTKYLSQEAFAASKIDTDKDRVADSLETYLGTDKNKKDTDGDTYTDYEEINRGSDPKGPGNLERSSSSGLYF